MPRVLFVCRRNACRSILAEALLRSLDTEHRFLVSSGGTEPAGTIHPAAAQVLSERLGADCLDTLSSKKCPDTSEADMAIVLCDDSCPWLSQNTVTVHWPTPDPAAARSYSDQLAIARRLFDDLVVRLGALLSVPWEHRRRSEWAAVALQIHEQHPYSSVAIAAAEPGDSGPNKDSGINERALRYPVVVQVSITKNKGYA